MGLYIVYRESVDGVGCCGKATKTIMSEEMAKKDSVMGSSMAMWVAWVQLGYLDIGYGCMAWLCGGVGMWVWLWLCRFGCMAVWSVFGFGCMEWLWLWLG